MRIAEGKGIEKWKGRDRLKERRWKGGKQSTMPEKERKEKKDGEKLSIPLIERGKIRFL